MAKTQPTGEQIRFRSANTGEHVLDTYLESAEIGGRNLTDLLDDLFDPSNNGTFRASNFEFRFDPATDKLQFRVGQFASATAGFTDLTTFFSIEGTFSTSTTYNNFDVVTLSNKDVYIVHGLSSGTTFSSESNFISSANTEKLVDVSGAQDWASKVNGIVDSTDYSSKAYAIGGTGVDTGSGSAKDWAIKTSGTVGNTSENSAKYHATAAASSASTATTQANLATTNGAAQVTLATAQVALATTQANNSASSASSSSTSATNSANSASAASTSETNAAASAATATTQAGLATSNGAAQVALATTQANNAASSATAASNSQTAAAASAASAANSYDSFDDRYLGAASSNPSQDNDGNSLVAGALYFNSTANEMRVFDGGNWIAASSAGTASLLIYKYTASSNQTSFGGSDDASNTLSYTVDNLIVTLNGVVLEVGTDVTATNGTTVVLASGAAANDELNIYAFKSFTTADMVSKTNGGAFVGNVDFGAGVDVTGNITVTGTVDGRDVAADGTKLDGIASSATANPNAINNVVEDTSPQLGGNFDLNNNDITGTGQIDISHDGGTGTVTATNTTGPQFQAKYSANQWLALDQSGAASYIKSRHNSGDGEIVLQGGYTSKTRMIVRTNGDIDFYNTDGTTKKMEWDATANALEFEDDAKAVFGAGSDLQIYHDSANSYIQDTGTGDLIITSGVHRVRTDQFQLNNAANNAALITAANGGEAKLFHNGSAKIYSQSHGARIDGGLRFASSGAASDTANPYIFRASGADNMAFATGSAERMRLTSAGSLGLGVTAPDGKLNVVSTAHNNGSIFDSTGTTQLWLRDTDATSNQRNWGFQVSGGDLNIVRANDDRASGFVTPVYIQQAPANSLVINSNGNATFNGTVFAPNVSLYPNSSAPNADAAIFRPQDGHLGFVAAASERGRFAGGTFLVGKTSSGTTTAGFEAQSSGLTAIVRDSNTPLYVGRNSNDGDIVVLRKGSTTAGTIGTFDNGVNLYIGSGDTGVTFNPNVNGILPHNPSTNAQLDNAIDLGYPTYRFKDLYLSGGVYLGGNGSTNLLDDYEEGTWTPTASGGYTVSSSSGAYTKIGRVVHLWGTVQFSGVGGNTSTVVLGSAPFTNSTHLGTGVCRENTNTGAIYVFRIAPNSTSMEINTMTGVASGTRTIRTGENYAFHGSYYVA